MRVRPDVLRFPRRVGTVLAAVASLLLAGIAGAGAASAPAPPAGRPRIGLALSGGGARGFAHVGVLEWLEENHIPVDYVAGTSMGGLIGGLYAMGYAPAEIHGLVQTLDWEDLFRIEPAYRDLSWRRKEDLRKFGNQIELGMKDGLRPPSGLNSGHQIGLLLDRLTLPYGGLESFDRLPIPFRCVATDMERAEAVVLGDGSLSSALRATMSIPGVFAPVERDGRILADGGILDNLPVGVVRSMGADVVIAVDISTPVLDREEMQTIFGMLNQTIGVMMISTTRASLARADHAIRPDLGDHGNLDFRDANAITDLGRAAAVAAGDGLLGLAVSESEWRGHLEQRSARRRRDAIAARLVAVHGADPRTIAETEREIRARAASLEPALLERELTSIVGRGRIARAGYGLDRDRGLDVYLQPKTYGPPFLRLGIDLSHDGSQAIDLTLKGRLLYIGPGAPAAEIRADVAIGTEQELAAEYYRPLGRSRLFVAPRGFLVRSGVDLYREDDRVAEYTVKRAGVGLDGGFQLGRSSELRTGFELRRVEAKVSLGDPLLPSVEGKESLIFADWVRDRRDSGTVPSRGYRVRAAGSWFLDTPGAERSFTQVEGEGSVFVPLATRGTLFGSTELGSTLSSQAAPPEVEFTIGGPLRVSALRPDELRGSHYVIGRIGYLHPVLALPLVLGGRVYLAAIGEVGSAFDGRLADARFQGSLLGGVVADTVLGGLVVGAAVGDDGQAEWFFRIGRLF